ncbi:MAG: MATE family efflux transporter [Pleomorphochaeta sp.]
MFTTEKRGFYKKLIQLSVPIMLHQLLLNSASFVDTIMIGHLGAKSIAAVGIANQMFFLINLIYFGLGSGSSVLMSQFWGAKKTLNFQKTIVLAILTSSVFALIFSISSFFFPEKIMQFFTHDETVITLGVQYLKIVSISYIFSSIGFIYATAFRATHNTQLPLFIATLALTINTIGNYLLIFGIGPFPELGVQGAAISTAFCRFLEVFLLISFSYKKKYSEISLNNLKVFKLTKEFIKNFYKACSPVILNELTWALGMVAYKYAFSKMGTNILAAVQVTESITGLFFVVAMGFSMSASIMIGNKIGEKNYPLSQTYAIRFNYLSILSGIGVGLILYFVAPVLTKAFSLGDDVSILIIKSLSVYAFLLPLKFLVTAIIVGILRGGGSTTFAFLTEALCIWLIGVPSVFIAVFVFNVSLPVVYLVMSLEEISKGIIGLLKIKRKTWIKDFT